ncbi:DMT family transporter [Nereida sp. MMG025]|uniref:DMT family transporter n=1 Tax=Nereida sp. MMG025 TaxID=2909981 RepID=UPI001F47B8E8|nr:DMT family transporter [Nereida sp. MMG025]MCF6445919.1 DMT family transporter [Nereida sp. MMG025]
MSTHQNNTRGAVIMMMSMFAFVLNDTAMKALSDQWPLFQALTVRGVLTTLMISGLAWYLGAFRKGIAAGDWLWVTLRVLAEIGAAYFFITALFNMPLANATAILQSLPLTVSLAGAVFLGEAIGWRRLSAIIVGFIGVLLIVQPGADGFNIFSIYVLVAVAFVTLRDIVTRKLSKDTHSMVVTLMSALGVTLWAAAFSLTETWQPFTQSAVLLTIGASVFILFGYLFSVMVMRVGDIAFVAPFRYTALIWALILGFFVFDDWPNTLTLTGAGIVVASGLFTFYRERQIKAA